MFIDFQSKISKILRFAGGSPSLIMGQCRSTAGGATGTKAAAQSTTANPTAVVDGKEAEITKTAADRRKTFRQRKLSITESNTEFNGVVEEILRQEEDGPLYISREMT
jgi:hypothetical protein